MLGKVHAVTERGQLEDAVQTWAIPEIAPAHSKCDVQSSDADSHRELC